MSTIIHDTKNAADINELQVKLLPYSDIPEKDEYDLDGIIYNLDNQIDLLSNKADKFDYLISIASGVLSGMLDILWIGDFNLEKSRTLASNKIDAFVIKTAKMLGHDKDDLKSSVRFLEENFKIPSDRNSPDFGGGSQHHLHDFAHHPTIVGLMFSLLTQFTGQSYGTRRDGSFHIANVSKNSMCFIGKDIPTKIFYGTITWFFHLVSDVSGSSSSVYKSGGTGIPGPLLSLIKEMSALPFFENINVGNNSLSTFLLKLFNGTIFAEYDIHGNIVKDTAIKFDLRGELGVGLKLAQQALPVIANECMVRAFYFIRRFAVEIRENNPSSLSDLKCLDFKKLAPAKNPTVARMLTIATGVFTAIDVSEAVVTQKYWIAVNYVGIGRFAVAIGEDVSFCLKARKVKQIKQMYEDIKRFSFRQTDEKIYENIGEDMNNNKLGLTIEQVEILYNLEFYKIVNDIEITKLPIYTEGILGLKQDWLNEWVEYITKGFSSFLQIDGAEMHWYDKEELIQKVEDNAPTNPWFRLVLLEAMLFEPYYPLSLERNKKNNYVPSKKYKDIQNIISGYKKDGGDAFLDSFFTGSYYTKGYIKRLRKCYDKVLLDLNEVLKTVITTLSVTAAITVAVVFTAGAFAPAIAVMLVGSNFAGLSGAALTGACLAYIGGGAIAIGGAGMAGGTIAIVGGGAILGLGVGAGVGGAVGAAGLLGKKNTIIQSAKLLVSVKEIFLNDEHDIEYSNSVYEKYVNNIMDIEKGLVELKLKADVATGDEKKKLKAQIKSSEDSVEAMKVARKNLLKFQSSFTVGKAGGEPC